jgi:hypothetical protein
MTSRPSTAAPILAVLAIVLAMLGAYVLSIGPVYGSGRLSESLFCAVYWPVIQGARVTGLSIALAKYALWWDDHDLHDDLS